MSRAVRGFALVVVITATSLGLAAQDQPSKAPAPETKEMPRLPASNTGSKARPDPGKSALLQEFSISLESVTAQVGKAVVQIFARTYVPVQDAGSDNQLLTAQNSSGSGVILTPDGYILTNAHVVSGARSLKVQLPAPRPANEPPDVVAVTNRAIPARVIGIDRTTDLAVIKVDRNNLPFLSLGDSARLKQGQVVLALGNPLGLDNSVSMGVVSAVARQLKPDDSVFYIQTDAPINPGNSGGPLVDTSGRVVGINTMIFTQSGGSEGIGFAIPSNVAHLVYNQLRKYGHVHRAQLGITAEAITPAIADGLSLPVDHGLIVSDVAKGGPADHAGLQPEDIILAMNGRRMMSPRQLELGVYREGPESTVTLTVQRGEQRLDLFAKPEEQPDPLDEMADLADPTKNIVSQLGIVGLDITPKIASMLDDLRRPAGVLVAAASSRSPFTSVDLKTGDVIFSVNRKIINSVAELKNMMDALKPGQPAVLLIQRENRLLYVPVETE